MSNSALALIGFVSWSLLLTIWIAGLRAATVMSGKKAANEFDPSGSDVSAFSGRLCRAHANCYENLPMFAAIVLLAIATGQTSITDPLALIFVAARIAQSTVHLISTSVPAVNLRFLFFVVQVVILIWWIVQFFQS